MYVIVHVHGTFLRSLVHVATCTSCGLGSWQEVKVVLCRSRSVACHLFHQIQGLMCVCVCVCAEQSCDHVRLLRCPAIQVSTVGHACLHVSDLVCRAIPSSVL